MRGRIHNLRLGIFLNSVLGIVFIIVAVVGVVSVNISMHQQAIMEARSKAGLILDRNFATHTYFSKNMKPSILAWSEPFRKKEYFDPTWMSSTYAIREIEKVFKSVSPSGYYFKDAAFNARSPENEADEDEKTFLKKLGVDKKLESESMIRQIDGKSYLVVLKKGEVMEQSCLGCHGNPKDAPKGLTDYYGSERSFNRQTGEVVSAVSLRIPLSEAYRAANIYSLKLSAILLTVLAGLFIIQYWVSRRYLLKPLKAIQAKATQIAVQEEHLGEQIAQLFGWELNQLATAFNKMSVKLRQDSDCLKELVDKRTETLQQEKNFAENLIATAQVIILVLDPEGKILLFNPYLEMISGYSLEEVKGKDWFETFLPERDRGAIRELFLKARSDIQTWANVNPIVTKDGEKRFIVWHDKTIKNGRGSIIGLLAVGQDITEARQKQKQERLAREVLDLLNLDKREEDPIHLILGLVKRHTGLEAVGIRLREGDDFPYYQTLGFSEDFVRAERFLCQYDGEGKVVRDALGNPVLECMCGNILGGRTNPTLPFFTESGSFWTNSTTKLLASTMGEAHQSPTLTRCNSEGYESVALIPLRSGEEIIGLLQLNDRRPDRFNPEMIRFLEGLGASIGIALSRLRADLERAQLQYEQVQMAERLRLILESTDQGIFGIDLDGKCSFANQSAGKMLGYAPGELIGKELHPLIHHSHPDGSPYPLEDCPNRITFQTGHVSHRDDEVFWRSTGQAFPIEYYSYPIRSEEKILGLVGTFTDITERQQAQEKLSQTLENLRKALGGIIGVISTTVEIRDPYTAGHQRRVANLARSIAQEMGLRDDQVEGLRMAGIIHDLGKISIPADILSKPTKLNAIEFALIKDHPQIGYDILKDIDFPWPIAEIIFQHHERMDGSGYPRGLKGVNILLESYILAVADAVEAMASHRPYRPALGIEKALEELEKNKGILYDNTVVEACLRLFREKGFQFEGK